MEAIGQLTGGIAHDFNNLLTPIIATLDQLMRKHDDDERSGRMVDAAMQSAEKARALVSRLLSFARRQHLDIRPVRVDRLVSGMSDLVARSLGATIELHLELPDRPIVARVDPNQLELALLNLSVNARDAMPSGGKLRIKVDTMDVGKRFPIGLDAGQFVRI